MKKTLMLFAMLLCLTLAACGTDRPTNVTPTSAVLHAHGNCEAGYHLYWWYDFRDVDPNMNGGPPADWRTVGPWHRVDCGNHSDTIQLEAETATGLIPEHRYQYRVGYQPDGQPISVCDRTNGCAQRYTAQENNLVYDDFTTPASENGKTGQDYDVKAGSGSVSGTYACDYGAMFDPSVIVSEPSIASILVDCRDDMNLKVTCKSELHIGSNVWYDNDYTESSPNVCIAQSSSFALTLGTNVGAHFNWYIRLNNSSRRWSSAFAKVPHRGACETYFVAVNGKNLHVLHCRSTYGKLGAPPT